MQNIDWFSIHSTRTHLREASPGEDCQSWPCQRVWRTGFVQSSARWCSAGSAARVAAPRNVRGSHIGGRWCSPPSWPGLGIASVWSFQGHSDLLHLWANTSHVFTREFVTTKQSSYWHSCILFQNVITYFCHMAKMVNKTFHEEMHAIGPITINQTDIWKRMTSHSSVRY